MVDVNDLHARGLDRRKRMLGATQVENRMAAAGDFGAPLQNIINAYVYGDIWERTGLSDPMRSLVMLAITAASGKVAEASGGERDSTNNRMELQALIEGLSALQRSSGVEVVTDSEYVARGCREWLSGWKRKGWKTADKKPVKNEDLWRALDDAMVRHQIHWIWVAGHSGHPENERADQLARDAIPR